MVYELTEWGAELEPILLGLQRWGAGSPVFPHDVPVGCDAAMLALKNAFDPESASGLRAVVEVRLGAGTFRVTVDDGSIDIHRGPADHPGAAIDTDPVTLEKIAFGPTSVKAAERSGVLDVHGDRRLIERFFELFPVPPIDA